MRESVGSATSRSTLRRTDDAEERLPFVDRLHPHSLRRGPRRREERCGMLGAQVSVVVPERASEKLHARIGASVRIPQLPRRISGSARLGSHRRWTIGDDRESAGITLLSLRGSFEREVYHRVGVPIAIVLSQSPAFEKSLKVGPSNRVERSPFLLDCLRITR